MKRVCRSLTIPQCEAAAQGALEMDDAHAIENYLKEELRRAAPELEGTATGATSLTRNRESVGSDGVWE